MSNIGIELKNQLDPYLLNINDFIPFFNDNREIINLQYGNITKDLNYLNKNGNKITNFKEINLFEDIESCLGLLSNLDLFITVSNTTAHLAGALGVPTILICPKKSSTYYYWNTYKKNSIWYKNIEVIIIKESIFIMEPTLFQK